MSEMQTLEGALETNRRLNRRVQELEGPFQSKLALLKTQSDRRLGEWMYAHKLLIQERERNTKLWRSVVKLSNALTILLVILAIAVVWR